jgi:hypothetical protein
MEVDKKDIVNPLYQSMLLSGVTIGYSYLLRKFFKQSIGNPSNASLEEFLKLDYLCQQIIIPRNIMKM